MSVVVLQRFSKKRHASVCKFSQNRPETFLFKHCLFKQHKAYVLLDEKTRQVVGVAGYKRESFMGYPLFYLRVDFVGLGIEDLLRKKFGRPCYLLKKF